MTQVREQYRGTLIMVNDSYLTRRGHVYWYKRRYPQHLVDTLGRYHRASLQTRDIVAARKLRDRENIRYLDKVETAEREASNPAVVQLAKQLLEAKLDRDGEDYSPEESALMDMLSDYIAKHDPKATRQETKAAVKVATQAEPSPALDDLLRDYEKLLDKALTKHTVHDRMRYLNRWRDSVGGSTPITALLDPEEAFQWAEEYILSSDLAPSTKSSRLKTMSGFFQWLKQRRIIKENPFGDIEVPAYAGRKGTTEGDRKAWTDDQLKRLMAGLREAESSAINKLQRFNAQVLQDMVLVGMYSGMRINEIASLRIEDCTEDTFTITAGKTHAAVRRLPIHPRLTKVVQRLAGDRKEGYLFQGLKAGGYDGKQSAAIEKAFGRLKVKMGFGPEMVFHSLRMSFIGKLHEAGCPVMLAKTIVGHKLNDLTYGHYSKAELLEEQRKAVEKVSYDAVPC